MFKLYFLPHLVGFFSKKVWVIHDKLVTNNISVSNMSPPDVQSRSVCYRNVLRRKLSFQNEAAISLKGLV
jgi:hypothetical protein